MSAGWIRRVAFFLAGMALMPAVPACAWAAAGQVGRCGIATREGGLFLAGAGAYAFIHLFLHRPLTIHVFGHELTHVLWARIFGGRVAQFKASQTGGYVVVTRSNFLVELAPYVFPLYAVAVTALYGLVAVSMGCRGWTGVFAAAIGFTLAFHAAMTVHSLRAKQPDLGRVGCVFALTFILLMNIVVLMLFLALVMPPVRFGGFIADSALNAVRIYAGIIACIRT